MRIDLEVLNSVDHIITTGTSDSVCVCVNSTMQGEREQCEIGSKQSVGMVQEAREHVSVKYETIESSSGSIPNTSWKQRSFNPSC